MGINHKHELLQLYLNKVSSVSWLEHRRQTWTQTGPSQKTVQNKPPVRLRHGLSSLFMEGIQCNIPAWLEKHVLVIGTPLSCLCCMQMCDLHVHSRLPVCRLFLIGLQTWGFFSSSIPTKVASLPLKHSNLLYRSLFLSQIPHFRQSGCENEPD